MYNIPFSFVLDSTDYNAKLSFFVHYNGEKIYECKHVNKKLNIELSINNDSDIHEITWTMQGKDISHTKVNEQGEIISDAALITSDFKLENFELGNRLTDNCYYIHNHNGNSDEVKATYDNYLGCNGTVHFTFTSPAHIWILQNW